MKSLNKSNLIVQWDNIENNIITIKDKEQDRKKSKVRAYVKIYRMHGIEGNCMILNFSNLEIAFCLWIDNQGLIHTYQHLSIDNAIR